MTAAELSGVFCGELVEQELDNTTPVHPDPGGNPRFLQNVPPRAARPRLLSGKEAGHAGEDLLQIRGQQHQRQPQAQFGHRAGILRQKSRASRA